MHTIITIVLIVLLVAGAVFIITDATNTIATRNDTTLGDVAVTAAGEMLARQMTQAAATPTPGTPAPSAAEIAATIQAVQINAASTQRAEERQAEYVQATQQARAQAVQATQQAQAQAIQATQAAQAQATKEAQEAQATATGEYWRMLAWNATQTVAYEQTAAAWSETSTAAAWTQTAIPMYATQNAGEVYAQQTIVAGQALQVEQATKKQAWAGPIGSVVAWFATISAIVIVGFYVREMKKVRRLAPDGSVNLIESGPGVKQVVNSALMPAPVLTLNRLVTQVQAGGATGYQENVTRRAQGVQALAAVANSPAPRRDFEIVGDVMGSQGQRYAVSEPPAELVGDEVRRTLDAEWKAASDG